MPPATEISVGEIAPIAARTGNHLCTKYSAIYFGKLWSVSTLTIAAEIPRAE
jgi:hypothetical protein